MLDSATTDLLTIDEAASITEAAKAMSKAEIRHLAITRNGVVTGIVSIRDVLNVPLEAQG